MRGWLILAGLAAAALAAVCLRLWTLLARARSENRRLREIVTLNSRYKVGDLEELRRLRHDMRHYAIAAGAVPPPTGEASSGPAIRSLVEHYRAQAADMGVDADLMLDVDECGDELLPDLCLVVSNLLENAVEALRGQENGWLRGRSCCTDGYISLVIGNSCTAPLRVRHGVYRSTKSKGRSGIGLVTVADLPSSASPAEAMDSLQAAVAHEHSSDLALDSGMREKFADHFGPVASKVRFVESDLPAQLGAKAFAQGDTIRVAPGAYTPGTESGEKLLAHELGHAVQQSRGEAMDGAGMPLLDSSIEHGADTIADSAMSGSLNVSATPAPAASAPMLCLGFLSKVKGWFNKNVFKRNKRDQVKEQVKLRPWKMTAEQLKQNKYNPGGSESVARDNYILNSGWVEGADNEYNLRTLEENFGTLRKFVNNQNEELRTALGEDAKQIRGLAQAATNRKALVTEGQTSVFGSENVNEMIAEAFSDVYAHGKEASKLNKQIVKRLWRKLNPDAAYEEYQQKQADYASGKRRKRKKQKKH